MVEEKRTFKVVAPDGELKEWEIGVSEARRDLSLESCQLIKSDEIIKQPSNQARTKSFGVVFEIGRWLGNVIKYFVLLFGKLWQKMTTKKYPTYDDYKKGKCLMSVEEDLIINEKELRYEQSDGRSGLKLIMVISDLKGVKVVFTEGRVVGEGKCGLAEFNISSSIGNLEISAYANRERIVIDLDCLVSMVEKHELLYIELVGSDIDLSPGQKKYLRKIRFRFAKLGGKSVKYHCTFCASSTWPSDLR